MVAFTVRRLLALIPTLLVISAITFFMGFLAPSDPIQIMLGEKATDTQIATLKRQYGLDLPWYSQYGRFLAGAAKGDFGKSYAYVGRDVFGMVKDSFWVSVKLGVCAALVASTVGIGLGVIAAVNRSRLPDAIAMFFAVLGISIPNFIEAIALMYLLAVWLQLLPAQGWGDPQNYVLPVMVLGTRAASTVARITRSAMLDVLGQDYVRTARAKGLATNIVILKHGLKNALIPVLTILGTTFGNLIAGSFVVERIFGIPGMGKSTLDAIGQRDYPVIQVGVLLIATVFVLTNLVVDLMYGVVDPRIRYS